MSKSYVYTFSVNNAQGNAKMRDLLGGKGANLAEMANLGMNVPPGFTITTEACIDYFRNDKKLPESLWEQVLKGIADTEKVVGRKFGDKENPLLFSVRSGAKFSMPGMMDTILNIGLNDENMGGFIRYAGNERTPWDCYRRLITMFGDVACGVDRKLFEKALEEKKKANEVKYDAELGAEALRELVDEYKNIFKEQTGYEFPQDPYEQLQKAIDAVFDSWNNPRAVKYRRIHGLPDDMGTAVNVQTMVFGNLDYRSGTGVAFTRNPSTGENKFYGEFLINAQGEDVVAGIRTPQPIEALKEILPEPYEQLVSIHKRLEQHYKDMQDMEFSIEKGVLYILQTRNGKRTGLAAIKIALDMLDEGLIDEKTAFTRIHGDHLNMILHDIFPPVDIIKNKLNSGADPEKIAAEFRLDLPDLISKYNMSPTDLVETIYRAKKIAKGLPASPGAASGKVVFTADQAEAAKKRGEKVILVRHETSAEDMGGMHAAVGILTARGGMTSHAAVVARGMGKCCVAGSQDIIIDNKGKTFLARGETVKEGDYISLDGNTGEVYLGFLPAVESEVPQVLGGIKNEEDSEIYRLYKRVMEWADKNKRLGVRTNAETPRDTEMALKFGAEGIGLCRTEHMFFGPEEERILHFREMILSNDTQERIKALEKLKPYQKSDFKKLFRIMKGLPVTIRLLDPPLHEFVPIDDGSIKELADYLKIDQEAIRKKLTALEESNPMMGHRGCRLTISYPEILDMQASAILEAAIELADEGIKVLPEIMIPLVGIKSEMVTLKDRVDKVAKDLFQRYGKSVDYTVGAMMELPRACLVADDIAEVAEFFSFGTNDLTQMTFGFSRDDAGVFLDNYLEEGLLQYSPFETLDTTGVGQLIKIGIEKGREVKPRLKIGICGEHGGDPKSVEFCHSVNMDYVSCSPYRIPIARLHAAIANVREKDE